MLRGLISTSLVFFALVSCTNYGTGGKEVLVNNSAQAKPDETLRNTGKEQFNIKNTRGVVVLNKYSKGDFVRFYNADGSLWYEFSYFYDDSDGKFEYANDEFRPFAFHQDYFLLVLKCTETSDKFFEVVVNEETGLRKHVKANDPVLKLEPWEKFVLSVFALKFDKKANPILETPNGHVKTVDIPAGASFRPVEAEGEWLKIRWDTAGAKTGKTDKGWIRWKSDESLLIDFHYFS